MGRFALSIDVEDWFCVGNMQHLFPFDKWKASDLRVRIGTDYLLNVLAKKNQKATFFVLGWIAENVPGLVKDIASGGHEIASHGYSHQPLTQLTESSFDLDLARSLQVLNPLVSQPIQGFRAPSFSITKQTMWAFSILKKHGISYDSSIFPIYHPNYGIPDFGNQICTLEGVTEVPMNAVKVLGFPVPISGGGYFRLLPYPLMRRLLKKAAKTQNVVLYFHPWEFDAEQPRMKLPPVKYFRHYYGLKANRRKFEALLSDFSFSCMKDMNYV